MHPGEFDFIDFGASRGDSIEFARARLGGGRGLGIDRDPKKVELLREAGYEGLQADVRQLDLPPRSVRFVVMSHFLEHLPDIGSVEGAVRSAKDVASDFLFIQGPMFDADDYLRSLGLKFYWSDWHGHPCHLTAAALRDVLERIGLPRYRLLVRGGPAVSSDDPAVHPLDSPRDQHEYDPGVHPPKPSVRFSAPIYKEIVCCVALRPLGWWQWRKILRARRRCRPLEKARPPRVDGR